MNRRVFRLLPASLMLVVAGIFCLAMVGTAQDQPAQVCREALLATGTRDNPIVVNINDLRHNPEDYYGKVVTVDGELHRVFTDNVYTIENSGFWRDEDILVISSGPMAD